ncbi:MAG: hypothetical protein Q4E72_02085 [bacterium]|nr:hypothetical protein [bacterium]
MEQPRHLPFTHPLIFSPVPGQREIRLKPPRNSIYRARTESLPDKEEHQDV